MRSFGFGFSYWKRGHIKRFFAQLQKEIRFCSSLDDALKKGLSPSDEIYIWGMRKFDEVEKWAGENGVLIKRVEDGFIRSVTLGSDLTKAYSLVIDKRGIYFDATKESDLEWIYNNYIFDEKLLNRAYSVRKFLIERKISKYNILKDKKLKFNSDKKITLVIGQVEDDASIIYGGFGMKNIDLLKKVFEKRGDEFIVYKPHPDVVAGNRKGYIPDDEVLKYADTVIKDISLPSLLDVSDEVHTITSLSGFEAIIRNKPVYTYGMPFYAGWGLSEDERKCLRRKRKLSINELIAGAYILYPHYISPLSGKLCGIETFLKEMESIKKRYHTDTLFRCFTDFKSFVSRKSLLALRKISGE